MIRNTFCHLPGIGEKNEKALWVEGIRTWQDFSSASSLSPAQKEYLGRLLDESREHLDAENPAYFSKTLRPTLHWRLFPEFRHKTAYLDIETNGLVGHGGYITTIAMYDGTNVRYYIRGENLEDFKRDIRAYSVVVTYNGKCFDVPYIESQFNITMDHAHIDLMHVLRSLGYRGGLKGCEKAFGIGRDELDGVDGFFAVLLWREYRKNKNPRALETLVAYNILDAVNLESLMVEAYNLKVASTPFHNTHRIEKPPAPENPISPDPKTIDMVYRQYLRFRA